MPVIAGAKGILTKILKGNLEAITRKRSIDSLKRKRQLYPEPQT